MKFDEREIRGAMDRRLSVLEASAERRAHIRSRIAEEEPVMRRRMTWSAALALALILALTGVALAVGVNLFEFFGKNDERLASLADQAAATSAPAAVETQSLGRSVGTIHNAWYDGRSLLVAYSLENDRRIEAFVPTEEQLAQAQPERVEYVPTARNAEEARVIRGYEEARARGEACGLAIHTVYPGDHSYGNGADLEAWTETEAEAPDGSRYLLREYETPLPEAARDRELLALRIPLRGQTAFLWFDGEASYVFHGKPVEAGEMTARVPRTQSETRAFAGTGESGGVELRATAQVSAVHGELILTGENAFPALEKGSHYDVRVYDGRGEACRLRSMSVEPGRICVSFYGCGSIPDKLRAELCIERNDSRDVLPAAGPIELTPTE